MTVRELTYGEAWIPSSQRSLRTPKGERTQERWIVAVFSDHSYHLAAYQVIDGVMGECEGSTEADGYGTLWADLSTLATDGRKWWLIGWRINYALQRANFTAALESGLVKLPIVKSGKNKGKHSGKLSLSGRVFEVDVECGKNKIKLLDWSNFGVRFPDGADGVCGINPELAAKILRDFLESCRSTGIDVCKCSAAQLGWYHFRANHQRVALSVNLDPISRALERAAYHGGRNEAFRLGDIPGVTYSLDVASCYATICRDELLPCRLLEEYPMGLDVDKIDQAGADHWIAEVVLRTDEADYPLRWERTPIFPVGQFRTALPWPELRHALLRGRVVRVLRAARYAAGPVLREYACWYLTQREACKEQSLASFAAPLKAIFNASLGYSARQKYEWVPWETEIGFPYWLGVGACPDGGDEPVSCQKLDDEARWLKIAGEPRESMPFLHATITSYARVKLLSIFAQAGRENILYCDTDGILVNETGRLSLSLLGEWTSPLQFGLTERFAPGKARIAGQKTYQVGDEIIAAGVVGTRRSITLGKGMLTTPTGRASADGRVEPFRFDCQDTGEQGERWVNEEV